ncbi:MAG: 4-alpha-glucanotransferase [Verrucomicrobia bacterium]|nr:4-alpha-glucanotransferase [Verrucomicrobiota bacterium]
MNFPRASGILLHPTSLPGPYGMGEIGPQARLFADKLQAAKQRLWQMLPLGPTGYADSPYQSLSTFAGNPQLISFDLLVREGLLSRSRLARFPEFPRDHVDYGPVLQARTAMLQTASRSFDSRAGKSKHEAFAHFCRKHANWLDDFALFFALKNAHELRPWTTWAPELARREPAALKAARRKFKTAIRHVKIEQFLFADQWARLRKYCHKRGIQIVGDIPIFVAHDSADVWAHPELFYLDERGFPTIVAGVPPDYFSATGQLWGNPLYRWDVHRASGYGWWVRRMRHIFEMVDIVRIDHFRGFEAYWEIPGTEKTAIHGRWVPGPGADLFNVLRRELGGLPIIAEDLGVITPAVEQLRDQFQFPGMRILQFAFGNDAKAADYRPESYPPNCAVYSGTHDNDTTVGWFRSEPGKNSTRTHEDVEKERRAILDYLKTDGSEIHWDLIRLAMRSRANTVVFPLQDILGLGSEARMNVPGTTSGNWTWRFAWDQLTPGMEEHLRRLTEETGRAS